MVLVLCTYKVCSNTISFPDKMLKLGEDYTPKISDYITAKVLGYCKETYQLMVKVLGKIWIYISCYQWTLIKLGNKNIMFL